ncbi:hypothetical protein [Nitriliruptor alkaliphilus]|uniref:hypothetical protein n=1 Tax=Nitriliruptor alkaliphilus TaxID=427918 RepID=UPI000696532F|nr:hypothetical protein [Nitriliruptor alkaliphilus]
MSTSRFLVVALAVLASACSGVNDQISELRGQADDTTDRVQFCLAVTRAVTAVDGGSSPAEAQAAAEEVLTQVPDEMRADAELVAQRLREAAEAGDRSALDEEFRTAAANLRDGTKAMCDPRK